MMNVITITLSEFTDWEPGEDGTVIVLDDDSTTETVVGCSAMPEEAAAVIAAFCRDRPDADDGSESGEEVLPVSHFTLHCVAIGAPLSAGASWWAHVPPRERAEDALKDILAGRASSSATPPKGTPS
jgi:hypothetical protein